MNKKAKDVTKDDYDDIWKNLNRKGSLLDWVYEKDSKGKIHVHGLIKFERSTPYFKNMVPRGFTSLFVELYDAEGWRNYLNKGDTIRNGEYMFDQQVDQDIVV